MTITSKKILEMEDRLIKLKVQLDFLLRAFGALSTDKLDEGMRATEDEASQGVLLCHSLTEEMESIALSLASEIRNQTQG